MRYIYMNNYRGFANACVPIARANFLVGENSTGKSSFLKLMNLFSQPYFALHPDMAFSEIADLGGFDDMVSAWSKDKSFFEIGIVEERRSNVVRRLKVAIYRFRNAEGVPKLASHIRVTDDGVVELKFLERGKLSHRITKISNKLSKYELAVDALGRLLRDISANEAAFNEEKETGGIYAPIPFILARLSPTRNKETQLSFRDELLDKLDLTWIAPIRSAPKQFYGGVRGGYSPEGEHTPFVLRKALNNTDRSGEFAAKLNDFGLASGLFETIETHTFGDDPHSPFELLVKFSGATLNINNVGYGVSQALPLVVEFLSRRNPGSFAVQQPEVHLHPRAQAALGGLIFELAHGQRHSFYIETHSDYLIDRFRYEIKQSSVVPKDFSQVIFFSRAENGNKAEVISIGDGGSFPLDQPREFREFFIREEMRLLDL